MSRVWGRSLEACGFLRLRFLVEASRAFGQEFRLRAIACEVPPFQVKGAGRLQDPTELVLLGESFYGRLESPDEFNPSDQGLLYECCGGSPLIVPHHGTLKLPHSTPLWYSKAPL